MLYLLTGKTKPMPALAVNGKNETCACLNLSTNLWIFILSCRRPVSTSLASDFRDRMDKLMLSLLRKQAHQCYYDENFAAEDDEQPVWRQNIEFHDANQVATSSLVPLPFQTVRHPGNWEQASVVR